MVLMFDQLAVKVNGSGILAESASISSKNTLDGAYSIGNKGICNQIPKGGIENNFSLSYYINLSGEPCFSEISNIKSITGLYGGINIEVGGITGFNCLLSNYQLQVSDNQLVKAQADFISYKALSGQFTARPAGDVVNVISGMLSIGWTTIVISGSGYIGSPVYEFGYSFSPSWQPLFVLGKAEPLQVDFMSADEKLTFIRDTNTIIHFSGFHVTGNQYFPGSAGNPNITLYRYDYVSNTGATSPSLLISMSGARLHNFDTEIKINDFIKTKSTAYNYF